MAKYIGSEDVDVSTTKYKDYTPSDWVLFFIWKYGQIDGGHHKQWVIDQTVRILLGNKINISLHKWDDGNQSLRVSLDETPTKEYEDWVTNYKNGDDGPDTYEYNQGIAP